MQEQIEAGVDLNALVGSETALHAATRAGQLNAVRVLLGLGAKVCRIVPPGIPCVSPRALEHFLSLVRPLVHLNGNLPRNINIGFVLHHLMASAVSLT